MQINVWCQKIFWLPVGTSTYKIDLKRWIKNEKITLRTEKVYRVKLGGRQVIDILCGIPQGHQKAEVRGFAAASKIGIPPAIKNYCQNL